MSGDVGESPHLPRAAERAASDIPLEIYDAEGRTLRGVSRLLDVSLNGACVESTCEFNEGDGLVLRGAVGDGEVVPFRAVVVWRSFSFRLHRYGLRFDDLSPAARDAVDRFVSLTAARWRKKRH